MFNSLRELVIFSFTIACVLIIDDEYVFPIIRQNVSPYFADLLCLSLVVSEVLLLARFFDKLSKKP